MSAVDKIMKKDISKGLFSLELRTEKQKIISQHTQRKRRKLFSPLKANKHNKVVQNRTGVVSELVIISYILRFLSL